jgi:glutamate-1-semialdehyde aminotransferase
MKGEQSVERPKHLNISASERELARARTLIPGGVLGIRRPYNFVEGEYPSFFEQGLGGRVVDVDGNEYVDFLCAYGPIILGYREKEVDDAVVDQIRSRGFCFSLTQVWQNTLAEKLREIIPSAEMSLFVKTGSDATTTAIRLARAYTGRTKIIRCGYHGWHDWCVEVKGGIPEKLYEDVHEFGYNRLDELEALLKQHGDDAAAVIMTPFGHPLAADMQEPAPGFLQGAKTLAERYGAVLIFDEIRSGFRISLGGAQQYYGVTPHLSVFGKAMGNGYSIAAVCGREDIMKMGEHEVFISSTFFPNSLSYIAALKTIEIMERDKVLEAIWEKGRSYMDGIRQVITEGGYGEDLLAGISGIPPMSFITFGKDPEKRYKARRELFYTMLIRQGIFQQPYHHGYICYRHTEEDLRRTVEAVKTALAIVREDVG